MSEVTYFILYILQHNKGRHQPFWSDPLNPIFRLSLLFFLAGTLRSLPVQVRLLLVLAAAQSHYFMANRWGKVETVTNFIFLGYKITAATKLRHLLLGRKSYDKPRILKSILKSRDITLLTKVST